MLKNLTIAGLLVSLTDLFDWGTHWLDMMLNFTGQTPVEWVLAAFDRQQDHRVFGEAVEDYGILRFRFADGVDAVLRTEHGMTNTMIRVIGSEGMLEVFAGGESPLRYISTNTHGWVTPELPPEQQNNLNATGQSITELMSSLDSGKKPRHDADNALQATELIFGGLKSWCDRRRVTLPLGNDDIQLEEIMRPVRNATRAGCCTQNAAAGLAPVELTFSEKGQKGCNP